MDSAFVVSLPYPTKTGFGWAADFYTRIRDVVGGGEDIFQAIQITQHRG